MGDKNGKSTDSRHEPKLQNMYISVDGNSVKIWSQNS